MRTKLTYAALFAAFFLVAALVQWPAATLQGTVQRTSGGRWSLSGAEGTLWNGGATLLQAESGGVGGGKANSGRWRVVQNLRWKVRWNALWQGRLAVEVALEQGSVLVTIKPTGVSLEKLDAQLPAAVLAGLISGQLGRYGWTGALQVQTPAFQCAWQGLDCTGAVELLWQDAGVTEIPGPALGSYRIRIVGEGSSIHFDLATQEGRLQLTGNGEVGARGLRFTGEASATGAQAGQLEAQLRVLGRPAGTPGKYVIEYRDSSAPP